MRSPLAFLKFAAEVALDAVGFGVAGKLLVDVIPSVAQDLWERWGKGRSEEELRIEIQAVANATDAEVAAVVEAVASKRPPATRQQLKVFLRQVPPTIQSVSRKMGDPSGRVVDARLALRGPEDLIPLLPLKLPRFEAGQSAPGFGDWELVELLGVGGFGEVWKARNPHMASEPAVALKFCLDDEAAKLLLNEARLLDRVRTQGRHPGIVTLLDTALSSKPPALKYELVAGGDLAGLISRWRVQPPTDPVRETVRILHELADIVGFAHRLKPDPIVHRDLKPANVLVSSSGTLRVADFGIGGIAAKRSVAQAIHSTSKGAFLTEALRGACTIMYASPQQRKGDSPDPRDDVYSLGVVAFQMLMSDLTAHVSTDFADELAEREVPEAVISVVGKCLAGKAEKRPADAAALAEMLAPLLGPEARKPTGVAPENVKIQQATIGPLQVQVGTVTARQVELKDLPALPADILELEGKLAGLAQAIQALEAGSHPALEAARQAVAAAERQTQSLTQDLQANTPALTGEQKKALAAGVVQDVELSNAADLCDLVPESPTRVLMPYLRRLRNVELARRAEASAREQMAARVRDQVAALKKQSSELGERLGKRRMEDLHAVLVGFFERVNAGVSFPFEAWEGLEPQLEQRRYGMTDREMLRQAQKVHGEWKSQREAANATARAKAEEHLEAMLLSAYERGDGKVSSAEEKAVNDHIGKTGISRERVKEIVAGAKEKYTQSRKPTAGKVEVVDLGGGVQFKLAFIPAGEFLMGCPAGENGHDDEKPQHKVILSKGFWMGVHPVTQAVWKAIMGSDPSGFKGANRPVESVSWNECKEFCEKLSARTGRKFRLPTEAEWEYACRAGTTTAYHTGNGEDALKRAGWYDGNSGSQTHPVGEKEANAWKLQDMHGNVWEWCWDAKRGYTSSTMKDHLCDGSARVVRGGSWGGGAWNCRAACRYSYDPGGRFGSIGCRVVCCLD